MLNLNLENQCEKLYHEPKNITARELGFVWIVGSMLEMILFPVGVVLLLWGSISKLGTGLTLLIWGEPARDLIEVTVRKKIRKHRSLADMWERYLRNRVLTGPTEDKKVVF